MWLKFFEYFVVFLALALIIMQVVVPAWRGQKLFPWFRKQGTLESELAEVIQHNEEEKIQEEIEMFRDTDPRWFTKKGGIWFYEDPNFVVSNVRGRGETKEAAYRHWKAIAIKPQPPIDQGTKP